MSPRPPAATARALLRAARMGTLATATAGQPFTALVTPATAPDAAILLLLSGLSEHTSQLRADPRCALLVAGPPTGANPQTTPRLSVTGIAEIVDDPALKARYVAIHPYAALYAGFGDFALWRLRPVAGLLVAGFGAAHRLRAEALRPEPTAVAAIAAAEAAILGHCNEDHAEALARAARRAGLPPGAWRMVAVDGDGMDLADLDLAEDQRATHRIAWPAAVGDVRSLRTALMALVARRPDDPPDA